MTEEVALKELLEKTADEIKPALSELSPPELTQLEEFEREGKNRKGVVGAIEAEIERQQGGDQPELKPQAEKEEVVADTAKVARAEEIVAGYMKADYTGPLTIEQAQWRNEHLTQKRIEADRKK